MQYAVILPLLLLLTLGMLQAGLWLHGRNVAHRAAVAATDVAAGSYGNPGEARQLAERLAAAGGLEQVSVNLFVGATDVNVSVSAAAPVIFDIGAGRLHETAAAPRERVTNP